MRVKSEERRQAIVKVAKAEFIRQGFSDTSMSGIAQKVGGSKATLYNYFSSKEELFTAVMESSAKKMVQTFSSLSPSGDLREELIKFGINYLASFCSPELSAIAKMAYSEADRSDVGRHFYENGPKKGLKSLDNFLAGHIQKQRLISCDSWIATLQFKALMEAELREPYLLAVISEPNEPDLQDIAIRAVDSFMRIYGNAKNERRLSVETL